MTKTLHQTIPFLLIGILLCLSLSADAQRRRGRNSRKTPGVLKNLPEFFINDNFMPKRLKQVYMKDATRLALRMLNKEQRLSKQSVVVPEKLVNSIYNSLLAIRVSDYGAIDTISMEYNVRTFPEPNVNYITLVFDYETDWAQPLRNRADTTGSPEINRLIRKYDLIMTKMVYLDAERGGLVLQSAKPLNMSALARKFFIEAGVATVEEMLPFGDGNDIRFKKTSAGWDILYSVRFKNCLRKCKRSYNWKFEVTKGGEVAYNGGKGDRIPPWLSVKNNRAKIDVPDSINKPKDVKPYFEKQGDKLENN